MAKITVRSIVEKYHPEKATREITPEQEAQVVAGQTLAAEEAEKKAAEEKVASEAEAVAEKVAKDADRQTKFDEANVTGEKVLLRKWGEPCLDRHEECSLDIHWEWAMPDGTVKHTRNHTW